MQKSTPTTLAKAIKPSKVMPACVNAAKQDDEAFVLEKLVVEGSQNLLALLFVGIALQAILLQRVPHELPV